MLKTMTQGPRRLNVVLLTAVCGVTFAMTADAQDVATAVEIRDIPASESPSERGRVGFPEGYSMENAGAVTDDTGELVLGKDCRSVQNRFASP